MPRGEKSKRRARKKRHKARSKTQSLKGAQASPESSSSDDEGKSQSSSSAGNPHKPRPALAPSTQGAAHSQPRATEGKKSQSKGDAGPPKASSSVEYSGEDPLDKKVSVLVQLLLRKYRMDEPITKEEMMKAFSRKYQEQFPEILRRATERLELGFGVVLKEDYPGIELYTLVSKTNDSKLSIPTGPKEFPKYRLLMPLLSMIFLNGESATEKEVWTFLNVLGLYDGRRNRIFGEPRELVTKEFVRQKYLEYRLMPNSDPPEYQFMWGPRAYADYGKNKVLKFMARINSSQLVAQYGRILERRTTVKAAAQAKAANSSPAIK